MQSTDTVLRVREQTSGQSRVFSAGKQLVLKGLTAGWAEAMGKAEAFLTLTSLSSPKNGADFLLPEWSGGSYSVETRKMEEGRSGEDKRTLSILLMLAWFRRQETSLLVPQDLLLGVHLWPPDRLFTELSQRA